MSRRGAWEFRRTEMRSNRQTRRELYPGCGHVIGPREPYRYFVGKARDVVGLVQAYSCDVCMRLDNAY